jgi:hypothetical protein
MRMSTIQRKTPTLAEFRRWAQAGDLWERGLDLFLGAALDNAVGNGEGK